LSTATEIAPATSGLPAFAAVDELEAGLRDHRYVADRGLATTLFLTLKLQKPLLLEGEAGVGKTEIAKVLSDLLQTPLIRLQCYEGLDAASAIYEWDYPRQMLYLRTIEATGALDRDAVRHDLFGEEFCSSGRCSRQSTPRTSAPRCS
jgi:MoxR-like ATPase